MVAVHVLRVPAVLAIAVLVLLLSGPVRRRLAGRTWRGRVVGFGGVAMIVAALLAVLSVRTGHSLARAPAPRNEGCRHLACTPAPVLGDYTGDVVVRSDHLDVVDRFVIDPAEAELLDAPPEGWHASTQRGRFVLTHRRSIPVDVPRTGRRGIALEVPALSVGATDIEAEVGRFRISAPDHAIAQTAPSGEQLGFGGEAKTVVALGTPDDPLEPPRIDVELRGAWARSPVLRWIGAINWGEWARWVVTTVFAGVLAPVGESLRRLLRRGRRGPTEGAADSPTSG